MKKRWFTLIEMLIVIVIIGILAWALIPRIGTARDKANDTAREANVRSLATAMVSYGLDHGGYPTWYLATWANDASGIYLTWYSIPDNNFYHQPGWSDEYKYRQLDGWAHFIIYTALSAWSEAWNCKTGDVADVTAYATANTKIGTTWSAFCYLQ